MKHLLYSFIASLLLFTSCSDANPILPEVKGKNDKHEVRFTVKNDNAIIVTRSGTPLSDKIKYLEYWVLDMDKADKPTVLHEVTTNASEINEQIQFLLPKGNYRIVVYATTNSNTVSNGTFASSGIAGEAKYFCISAPGYDTDAFSQTLSFAVDGTSTVIHDLALNRIVSRIELAIDDLSGLPNEVQSITPIVVGYTPLSGQALQAAPNTIALYAPAESVKQGSTNWKRKEMGGSSLVMPKSIQRADFASVNATNPIVIYYLPIVPVMNNMSGQLTSFDFFIQGSKNNSYVEMAGMNISSFPDVVFMRKIKTSIRWEANKIYKYTGKIGSLTGGIDLELNEQWDESSTAIDKE